MSANRLAEKIARQAVPVGGLDADSPYLLGLVPQAVRVAIVAASKAQRLFAAGSQVVQSVTIKAGPVENGTTANTGIVYVGGAGVNLENGYPLAAGDILNLGPVDLSELYIIGVNVGDSVRLLYQP